MVQPSPKNRRLRRVLLATVLLHAVLLASVAAAEPGAPVIGVNVVNPQWQPRAVQDATLDAVRHAGVRTIRVPFMPPTGGTYDGTIDYIRRAAERGLRVLLIVYPAFPPGAPVRPRIAAEPEMWSLPPLSLADPAVLAETYGPVLRKLDAQALELAAIEFGNEINWAGFNGEFPVPGSGRVLGTEDLADHPLGRRIAAGYRAYLRSLAELKRIRDGLAINRHTPILAAGLSDYGQGGGSVGRPLDAVSVGATLRFMRVAGLDRLVDGYSIHAYPDPDTDAATRRARLARDVLAECGTVSGLGKPCWITEWGIASPGSCLGDDARRATLVAEFRDAMAPALRDGRVRGLIYYRWDGGTDPYSLTRCGSLGSDGRAALAP